MTILEKILVEKRKEVANLKTQKIDKEIDKKDVPLFHNLIKASNKMSVIAEIKRSSPSRGAIQMSIDPVAQAKRYESLGASAISVLTDTPFFNGTIEDLREVRKAVNLPILCKDFMIDTVQIDVAKAAGANIILLIVAALSDEDLTTLYHYAKSLNLEIICEVHNKEEMKRALKLNPTIIGINNRDLKTFTVNLDTTRKLASMLQNKDTILISESGIKDQEDVIQVANHGADVILVGETLMTATNLSATFLNLQIPMQKQREKSDC